MSNALTPAEPADLEPFMRIMEKYTHIATQIWSEGRKDKDGLNDHIKQMLKICSEELQKVLPEEHHETIRRVLEGK